MFVIGGRYSKKGAMLEQYLSKSPRFFWILPANDV
jgi:hypothetical protein